MGFFALADTARRPAGSPSRTRDRHVASHPFSVAVIANSGTPGMW